MTNILKKTAALFSAAVLTASLTACGTSSPQQEKPFTVVTTMYVSYDFAKQLTANYSTPAEVKMLLTPGGESHAYEPTPSDVAAVQSCDLFVYIGGESEVWAEKLIASGRTGKQNLRMFDSVELLDEEESEGMQADESTHHHDEEGEHETDEHIWTSPRNADKMLSALHDKLNELRPEEQSPCDAAYDTIHEALYFLDLHAQDIRNQHEKDTLIFADRFPFRYLMHDYGWNYYAAFSGCSSDTDANAATLSFLIDKVKTENISTVFYLENSTQKVSDAICRATGAQAVLMQSGNNVTPEDFAAGKHYQDILRENLDAIEQAVS